jgi:hypothetical protein
MSKRIPQEGQVQPQRQLKIELPPETADGVYSNIVFIVHSPAEFILDFARITPGRNEAKVHSRIITNPRNAKGFLKALEANVKKYEEQHGEIPMEGPGIGAQSIGFRLAEPKEEE